MTTEEATTTKASPQLVSDTNLPATPNIDVLHTSSAQITDLPDITTAASSDDADASAQPASHQFFVTLNDATRSETIA
jgi:hypothetical protein